MRAVIAGHWQVTPWAPHAANVVASGPERLHMAGKRTYRTQPLAALENKSAQYGELLKGQ